MSIPSRLKSLAGGTGYSDTKKTITSGTTITLPESDNFFLLSGTATCTSLMGSPYIRDREVTLMGSSGTTTFTGTAGTSTVGALDLGGVPFAVAAKDILVLIQRASGVWHVKSFRQNNATSNSVASATTTTVPNTGKVFVLTGTATITTLSATDDDTYPIFSFVGGASAGVVFTNTESPTIGQMYLQGNNRLLQEQDVIQLMLQPDGTWFLVNTTTG